MIMIIIVFLQIFRNLSGFDMESANCSRLVKKLLDKEISRYEEAEYEESAAKLRKDIFRYQVFWKILIEESVSESQKLRDEIAKLCQRRPQCSEDAERETQQGVAEYVRRHSVCNDAEENLASLHRQVIEYMQRMGVSGDHADYWKIRCTNAERKLGALLHDEVDFGLGWRKRCDGAERSVESLSAEVEEYKLRLAKEKERVVELKCRFNSVLMEQWKEMDECCLQKKPPSPPMCPHLCRVSHDDE